MARPHPALLALVRDEPIEAPPDPVPFVSSTRDHRMSGYVLTAAQDGRIALADEIVTALATIDMAEAAHHRKLWATLEEVTSRLDQADIDSITFKGVTDEARWFSREGERPCSDVDVILEDVDRFDDALSVLAPEHRLLGHATQLARDGHIRALDLFIDGIHVDLHVDPVKVGMGWRHPGAWFAHTSTMRTPSDVAVRVFEPEAVTALKLLHLGRDRFRELFGLVEAHRIIATGVQWPLVMELARLEGLEAPVAVAAEIVAEELATPSPAPRAVGIRAELWRRSWGPSVRLHGQMGRARHIRRSQWLLALSMPGRLSESLRWMARSLIPPEPLFAVKHPDMRGSYGWRLTGGRIAYLARRRQFARRARDG